MILMLYMMPLKAVAVLSLMSSPDGGGVEHDEACRSMPSRVLEKVERRGKLRGPGWIVGIASAATDPF
jgi:hypothetical protein